MRIDCVQGKFIRPVIRQQLDQTGFEVFLNREASSKACSYTFESGETECLAAVAHQVPRYTNGSRLTLSVCEMPLVRERVQEMADAIALG